jgi:hypothetical protein
MPIYGTQDFKQSSPILFTMKLPIFSQPKYPVEPLAHRTIQFTHFTFSHLLLEVGANSIPGSSTFSFTAGICGADSTTVEREVCMYVKRPNTNILAQK